MKWESIASADCADAPRCAAVYVFILDGRAYYVGSTVNLRTRLMYHRMVFPHQSPIKTRLRFCQIIKFSRGRRFGDWLMREMRLIKRLKPEGNTSYKNMRSINADKLASDKEYAEWVERQHLEAVALMEEEQECR